MSLREPVKHGTDVAPGFSGMRPEGRRYTMRRWLRRGKASGLADANRQRRPELQIKNAKLEAKFAGRRRQLRYGRAEMIRD